MSHNVSADVARQLVDAIYAVMDSYFSQQDRPKVAKKKRPFWRIRKTRNEVGNSPTENSPGYISPLIGTPSECDDSTRLEGAVSPVCSLLFEDTAGSANTKDFQLVVSESTAQTLSPVYTAEVKLVPIGKKAKIVAHVNADLLTGLAVDLPLNVTQELMVTVDNSAELQVTTAVVEDSKSDSVYVGLLPATVVPLATPVALAFNSDTNSASTSEQLIISSERLDRFIGTSTSSVQEGCLTLKTDFSIGSAPAKVKTKWKRHRPARRVSTPDSGVAWARVIYFCESAYRASVTYPGVFTTVAELDTAYDENTTFYDYYSFCFGTYNDDEEVDGLYEDGWDNSDEDEEY